MNGLGYQLLARTAFSEDQDIRWRFGDLLDSPIDFQHLPALADHSTEGDIIGQVFDELRLLSFDTLFFHGFMDDPL